MDRVAPEVRSRIMASIRSKNTGPERAVRSALHALGYRFRLHRSDLPGTPDLVFPARRKVIFVHGCFWHNHPHCPLARVPHSRVDYWRRKLSTNVARDARDQQALGSLGWEVITVWECELGDFETLLSRVRSFLDSPPEGGLRPVKP